MTRADRGSGKVPLAPAAGPAASIGPGGFALPVLALAAPNRLGLLQRLPVAPVTIAPRFDRSIARPATAGPAPPAALPHCVCRALPIE